MKVVSKKLYFCILYPQRAGKVKSEINFFKRKFYGD